MADIGEEVSNSTVWRLEMPKSAVFHGRKAEWEFELNPGKQLDGQWFECSS